MTEKNKDTDKYSGILYFILIILILSFGFSIFSFWIEYKMLYKTEEIGKIKKEVEKISKTLSGMETAKITTPPEMKKLSPGEPAPIVELSTIDGEKVSTGKYRGEKKLLLYGWMPGCSHCEVITPKLIEFVKKHRDKNFATLTVTRVAYDEEIKGIKDYVKKKKVDLPVLISTPRDSFGVDYRVSRVPVVWVISEDLKIITVLEGEEIKEDKLEDALF